MVAATPPATGSLPETPAELRRQQRVGIGPDRVEGDVAEVEQAGQADHHVQAPAEHDVDQHRRRRVDDVAVVGVEDRQRQRRAQSRRRQPPEIRGPPPPALAGRPAPTLACWRACAARASVSTNRSTSRPKRPRRNTASTGQRSPPAMRRPGRRWSGPIIGMPSNSAIAVTTAASCRSAGVGARRCETRRQTSDFLHFGTAEQAGRTEHQHRIRMRRSPRPCIRPPDRSTRTLRSGR